MEEQRRPVRRRRRRKRKLRKDFIPWLLTMILIVGVIVYCICDICSYELKVTFPEGEDCVTAYGKPFENTGVEAVIQGGLLFKSEKTAKVELQSEVDTFQMGNTEARYTIRGTKWFLIIPRFFRTEVTRKVTVKDLTPPEIKLTTNEEYEIFEQQVYEEEGFTAIDDVDGDVTANVTSVREGDKMIYTVTDSHGNTSVVERQLRYRECLPKNGKTIYLTFDDGPAKHTKRLMAMLAKYNVKVTFFVVNSTIVEQLADIAAEGHSIGIHSYSHKVEEIYRSESAYFEDLEKMQALVQKYTGSRTNILRFPGGSSNTSSRYNPGIMTRLVQRVEQKGYAYFDWNVDSCDVSTAETAEDVFNCVVTGIGNKTNSFVLQHDLRANCVDAAEMIIIWGLENGYTFAPLTKDSPECHHNVKN